MTQIVPRRRFHDTTKRALAWAQRTAEDLGHGLVGTGHFIAGIVRVEPALLTSVPSEEWVRAAVNEQSLSVGLETRTMPGLPLRYSGNARQALIDAQERAGAHAEVRLEDVLEAIRRIPTSSGARLEARSLELASQQRASRVASPTEPGRRKPWSEEGESRSESDAGRRHGEPAARSRARTAEELIREIRRSVARGDLAPGEPLPSVRGLAKELDVAPGTVAKAYRSLRDEGVLETMNRTGTRVRLDPLPKTGRTARIRRLRDLMEPVVVAAVHAGASREELGVALKQAVERISGNSER